MRFYGRTNLAFLSLALILGAYSCSHKNTASDGTGNPDTGMDMVGSNADSVGSVPEDMLAEENTSEPSTGDAMPAPEATADGALPVDTNDAQADPFGDLKADATAPSEDSDSAGSESSGKMESYTVKSGDTLMKVAFQIYGDVDRWKDLKDWNKDSLKNGNHLKKGMKLTYEAPAVSFQEEQLSHSYEIKKGDTLANIADNLYGRTAKYKKLQKYNAKLIKNPNRIFAGFTIYYDITEKEMAEAEARRAQKQAQGLPAAAPAPDVPSAITPPAAAHGGKKIAVAPAEMTVTTPPGPPSVPSPSAADTSAFPGPGAPAANEPPPVPSAQ